MRREKTKVLIQTQLYLIEVDGFKTVVPLNCGNYRTLEMCYYKTSGHYNIVTGFNGAIIGTAKTVKEVEAFIREFAENLKHDIESGLVDIEKEVFDSKDKMTYDEWLTLAIDIEKETGIAVRFADRGGELSFTRLVSYLEDAPEFKESLEDGNDVDTAVSLAFGAEVQTKLRKLINRERIEG